MFDKEAWRDGSIAEKSRRSGADFLSKNQANHESPDQYKKTIANNYVSNGLLCK